MDKLPILHYKEDVMRVLSELGGEYIFKRPTVFRTLKDLYKKGNCFVHKNDIIHKIGECEVDELVRRRLLEESNGYLRLAGWGELQIEICLNLVSAIKGNRFPPNMTESQRKELSIYVKNILDIE
jgi:hypothetical protein